MSDDPEGMKPEPESEQERKPEGGAGAEQTEAEAAALETSSPVEQLAGAPSEPEPAPPTPVPPAEHRPPRWWSRHGWQLVSVLLTVATLAVVLGGECRARNEARERRVADSLATLDRRKALEAEQRLVQMTTERAALENNLRMAADSIAATARLAAKASAEANERERRAYVAGLDREMAYRLGLLTDTLEAVGIEPTTRRRSGDEYRRMNDALQRFLRPRDRLSQDVRLFSTTEELVRRIVERDPALPLGHALIYLRAIGGDELRSGAGPTRGGAEADTPSIGFEEPGSHVVGRRPLSEILPELQLERWRR